MSGSANPSQKLDTEQPNERPGTIRSVRLLITSPEQAPRAVRLIGPQMRLGRSEDNDCSFPRDAMLSRNHLCFQMHEGSWFVSDCGSRNGTVLNNSALKAERKLAAGDKIVAGHLTIYVQEETLEDQPSPFPAPGAAEGSSATLSTTLREVLRARSGAQKERTLGNQRAIDSLIRAGQELAVHRPLQELFTVILELALEAVDSQRGVILAYEHGQLRACASRGEGFAISKAVRDEVLRSKRSLVVNDVQDADGLRLQESIVSQRVRSLIAVPLQTGTDVLGLLYVDNGADLRIFSQSDLELMTVMANIAAIRIEHARLALVEEQDKLMQAELEQAAEIQRNLLPGPKNVPQGYGMAAYQVPCRAIGGDYYDFLPYADGRLALIVADVCGKGLPAALMMSSLQARVQMLADSFPEAAAALTLLNKSLTPRFPPGRFITAFYAVLQPGTGQVTYANAGHNFPVVVRHDGTIERLTLGALVLAIRGDTDYPTGTVHLQPGDLLCVFSDGVTEAAAETGEQFGEERLARILLQHRSETADRIAAAIRAELRQWSTGAFGDDLTFLLIRRDEDETQADESSATFLLQ